MNRPSTHANSATYKFTYQPAVVMANPNSHSQDQNHHQQQQQLHRVCNTLQNQLNQHAQYLHRINNNVATQSRLAEGRLAIESAQRQSLRTQDAQLQTHSTQLETHTAQLSEIVTQIKIQSAHQETQDVAMQLQNEQMQAQQKQIEQQAAELELLRAEVVHFAQHVDLLRLHSQLLADIRSRVRTHETQLVKQNVVIDTFDSRLEAQHVRTEAAHESALSATLSNTNVLLRIASLNGTNKNCHSNLLQLSKPVPPTSFRQFSKLPTEIRIRIWRLSLPDGKIVQVGYSHVDTPGFYHIDPPEVPALFFTCKEAYQVARAAYDVCLGGGDEGFSFMTPATLEWLKEEEVISGGVHYQRDRDTILLVDDAPDAFLEIIDAFGDDVWQHRNMNIQQLAIEHIFSSVSSHAYLDADKLIKSSSKAPKLKSLVLLSDWYRTSSGEAVGELDAAHPNTVDWKIKTTKIKLMSRALLTEYAEASDKNERKFKMRSILKWACGNCGNVDCYEEFRCLHKSAGLEELCAHCNVANKVSRTVIKTVQDALSDEK